mgnify:CR=1 FL=1
MAATLINATELVLDLLSTEGCLWLNFFIFCVSGIEIVAFLKDEEKCPMGYIMRLIELERAL